jgi:hypothetical protein
MVGTVRACDLSRSPFSDIAANARYKNPKHPRPYRGGRRRRPILRAASRGTLQLGHGEPAAALRREASPSRPREHLLTLPQPSRSRRDTSSLKPLGQRKPQFIAGHFSACPEGDAALRGNAEQGVSCSRKEHEVTNQAVARCLAAGQPQKSVVSGNLERKFARRGSVSQGSLRFLRWSRKKICPAS